MIHYIKLEIREKHCLVSKDNMVYSVFEEKKKIPQNQTKPKSSTHFPLCPYPPPERVRFTHLYLDAVDRSKILTKTLLSAY